MYIAKDWHDYEIIDTGGGEKLERWGDVVLRRPDPQIIWPIEKEDHTWKKVAARYHRSSSGGGRWEMKQKLPGTLDDSLRPITFLYPTNQLQAYRLVSRASCQLALDDGQDQTGKPPD